MSIFMDGKCHRCYSITDIMGYIQDTDRELSEAMIKGDDLMVNFFRTSLGNLHDELIQYRSKPCTCNEVDD